MTSIEEETRYIAVDITSSIIKRNDIQTLLKALVMTFRSVSFIALDPHNLEKAVIKELVLSNESIDKMLNPPNTWMKSKRTPLSDPDIHQTIMVTDKDGWNLLKEHCPKISYVVTPKGISVMLCQGGKTITGSDDNLVSSFSELLELGDLKIISRRIDQHVAIAETIIY